MHSERTRLTEYRLNEDLTFKELADKMRLSKAWVHQFLTSPKPRANERSLHQVRRFLDEQKTARRSRKQGAAA